MVRRRGAPLRLAVLLLLLAASSQLQKSNCLSLRSASTTLPPNLPQWAIRSRPNSGLQRRIRPEPKEKIRDYQHHDSEDPSFGFAFSATADSSHDASPAGRSQHQQHLHHPLVEPLPSPQRKGQKLHQRSLAAAQTLARMIAAQAGRVPLPAIPEYAVWNVGVKSMVPLSAVIGYALLPSRFTAVRCVGGGAVASGAAALKEVLVARRKRQAPVALLEALKGRDGLTADVRWADLEQVGRLYFLSAADMARAALVLYRLELNRIVSSPGASAKELDDLRMLKDTLRLQGNVIADCHAAVMEDVLNGKVSAEWEKVLYLSERMAFGDGLEGSAYLMECNRLRALSGGISLNDLQRLVSNIGRPFYLQVLGEMLQSPDLFSGEVLLRARRSLGITDVMAGALHLDTYHAYIQSILSSKGKFVDVDRADLVKIRSIMGVSQFEGERAQEAVTAPLYRDTLAEVIQQAAALGKGQPEVSQLQTRLRDRQTDLQLSQSAADSMLRDAARKLCDSAMTKAVTLLRQAPGSGTAAAAVGAALHGPTQSGVLAALSEVFRIRDAIDLIWTRATPNSDVMALFMGTFVGSPAMRVVKQELLSIYACALQTYVSTYSIDDEALQDLSELRSLMQVRGAVA
jgi:hypothetical protein